MGLGSAIALAVDRVLEPIEGTHRAATSWMDFAGRYGAGARRAHIALSGAVYSTVRIAASVGGIAIDGLVARDAPVSTGATAVVTGLWGDDLGRYERKLGFTTMLVGIDGQEWSPPVDPPKAMRLVILVHGFAQTERAWRGGPEDPSVSATIDALPDTEVVLVRYNTGVPISRSGDALAGVLERHLTGHRVESIVLIGYSMGGVVAHQALTHGRSAHHAWVDLVDDVITIATPFRGTPIEKAVHTLARAIGMFPQTRPVADFLDRRSQAIKDLRGAIPSHPSGQAAPAEHVRFHSIAGVISKDVAGLLGWLAGDLVVRTSSTGPPSIDASTVAITPNTHHFALPGSALDSIIEAVTDSRRVL